MNCLRQLLSRKHFRMVIAKIYQCAPAWPHRPVGTVNRMSRRRRKLHLHPRLHPPKEKSSFHWLLRQAVLGQICVWALLYLSFAWADCSWAGLSHLTSWCEIDHEQFFKENRNSQKGRRKADRIFLAQCIVLYLKYAHLGFYNVLSHLKL